MFEVHFYHEHWGQWCDTREWRRDTIRAIQDALNLPEDTLAERWRILRDGVPVASWEPGTGWRYWRDMQEIAMVAFNPYEWYYDMEEKYTGSPTCLIPDHIKKMKDYPGLYDAANAYLDALGLLLPDGALPPGLPQVDKPLHTPAEIAAWCRDHFDNADVRKAAQGKIPHTKCWTDDKSAGWHVFFEADSWEHATDNLIRDLHKYPDLHRELSRIIDEYVEPAPQSYPPEFVRVPRPAPASYSAKEVIAWLNKELWEGGHARKGEKYEQFAIGQTAMEVEMFGKILRRGKDAKKLRTNPAYLAAVSALLDKHGIQIRKEGSTMAQRSPIFGIKLACGSQIGFRKTEGGDVILLTSGPQLNGQIISNEDRHKLDSAGAKAATWKPESPSDEWRFE